MSDKPRRRGHPLVRLVRTAAEKQGIPMPELAAESGVNKDTIFSWTRSCSPRVTNLEAVLNALGYDLVAVPREPPSRGDEDVAGVAELRAEVAALRAEQQEVERAASAAIRRAIHRRQDEIHQLRRAAGISRRKST